MTSRSFFLLGWSFFCTLVRRPFARRGALRRTLDRLAADRLAALDPSDRAAVLGAGGCLACGRCDREAGRMAPDEHPSDGVLARSRDLSDVVVSDARFGAESAVRYEAVCPGGVPFAQIDRAMSAVASRVERGAVARPALPSP